MYVGYYICNPASIFKKIASPVFTVNIEYQEELSWQELAPSPLSLIKGRPKECEECGEPIDVIAWGRGAALNDVPYTPIKIETLYQIMKD